MKAFTVFKHLAAVVALVFTLVFSIQASAQIPTPSVQMSGDQLQSYMKSQDCKALQSAASTARDKFNTTCSQAKLGTKEDRAMSCEDKVKNCLGLEDDMDDSSEESGGDIMKMLTMINGMAQSSRKSRSYSPNGCPDMTASEGRDVENKLNSEIKDTKRDIDQTEKDITKLQKETADSFNDINRKVADLDEEYKKLQSQLNEEQLAAEAERKKSLAEAAQALRDLQKEIWTKEKQRAEALSNKAAEMSKFTDFVINNQCSIKIQEEIRKQVEANKRKGSQASLAKINSIIKNNAKVGYQECIATMRASRDKVRLQFDNAIQTVEEDLAQARQSYTDAQNNLAQLNQSLATAKENDATKKNDAYESYKQKRANLLQELQLLAQNSKSEAEALNKKLSELKADLQSAQTELEQYLASGTGKTKTLDDVQGDYLSHVSANNEYAHSDCPGKPAEITDTSADASPAGAAK